MARRAFGLVVVAFGMAFGVSTLAAQDVRVGGQVSFADDADFGIGPRLAIELPGVSEGLWLVGTFDYFFPDEGFLGDGTDVDYWELNGNAIYTIRLPDAPNVEPYIGAGINIARFSSQVETEPEVDVSDTNVGLNILGGLDFPLQGFTPFVEARIEIDGGEQFVVTGGILFP
ncbi:MAG: hypothetical protein R3266_05505 [Gemmatimonadota bacterium]|nr:hypothetical protein [Gemmatimonadota bacterium]